MTKTPTGESANGSWASERRGTKSLPPLDVVGCIRGTLNSFDGLTSFLDQLLQNLPANIDGSTVDQWLAGLADQRARLTHFITVLKRRHDK